jgi:hypothetical protein
MGDVEPKTPAGRMLFTAYVFYCMGAVLALLGTLGNVSAEGGTVRCGVSASIAIR